MEPLEPRWNPADAFDVQSEYVPTSCREVDNYLAKITPAVQHPVITELTIDFNAVGHSHRDLPGGANFENCHEGFNDPNTDRGEQHVKTMNYGSYSLQIFRNPDFWLGTESSFSVKGESIIPRITRWALAKEIQPGDFRQILTGYSDGYLRGISLPRADGIDTHYNGSIVVGPTEWKTLPHGETRYFSPVEAIEFDPATKTISYHHGNGRITRIELIEETDERTRIRLSFNFATTYPVVATTMYLEAEENASDVNLIATLDTDNRLTTHRPGAAELTAVRSVALFRTLQSIHNPNGVGLTISAQPEPAVASVYLVEAEEQQSEAGFHWRSQASPAVPIDGKPHGGRARQLQDGRSIQFTVAIPKTGQYQLVTRYSRWVDDLYGQASISLTIDGRTEDEASKEKLTNTQDWNNFKHHMLGPVLLEAGNRTFRLTARATPESDPGVELDTISFVYFGAPPADEPPTEPTPCERLDVNCDRRVTPLDALIVINALNLYGPHEASPGDRRDTQGDNWITPQDVLEIINYLNAIRRSGTGPAEGEGESPWSGAESRPMPTLNSLSPPLPDPLSRRLPPLHPQPLLAASFFTKPRPHSSPPPRDQHRADRHELPFRASNERSLDAIQLPYDAIAWNRADQAIDDLIATQLTIATVEE